LIASGKVKVHIAAIVALVLANLVAIFLFTMPARAFPGKIESGGIFMLARI
jgi:hypothetical protein